MNKYLLNVCYQPDTAVGRGESSVNKPEKDSILNVFAFPGRKPGENKPNLSNENEGLQAHGDAMQCELSESIPSGVGQSMLEQRLKLTTMRLESWFCVEGHILLLQRTRVLFSAARLGGSQLPVILA